MTKSGVVHEDLFFRPFQPLCRSCPDPTPKHSDEPLNV
jgi:hypothetical protein